MNGIHTPNDNFDFSEIILLTPSIQNGSYFIKFRINESPLYIQPPKCKTKQGIFKSGKKIYCDILFTNDNEQFIRWIENLETYCRKIMYDNKEKWFETQLDEHDIENYFTSPIKVVKSGKFYLTRANVPSILGNCALKAYSENGDEIDIETIKENMEIMTVFEIQGIKCSARNFQIEIEMKQIMLLNSNDIFEKCIFNVKSDKINMDVNLPSNLDIVTDDIHIDNIDHIEIDNQEDVQIVNEYDTPNVSTEEINNDPHINKNNSEVEINNDGIIEVEFDLDKINTSEIIEIKKEKDIYYEMYIEAKRKAKIARDLAVSSYLEAKRIKNTYMIDDFDDDEENDDIDLDEDTFIKSMEV
jgi:hypothetical protein